MTRSLFSFYSFLKPIIVSEKQFLHSYFLVLLRRGNGKLSREGWGKREEAMTDAIKVRMSVSSYVALDWGLSTHWNSQCSFFE